MQPQIILGQSYTDQISGFIGIATAKAEYLHGTHQTMLEPWFTENDTPPSMMEPSFKFFWCEHAIRYAQKCYLELAE